MTSPTRRTILDAGLEVFEAVGFERATVARLREVAGVSNGSFFHVFPSKEALAAALFLEGLGAYHAAMTSDLRPGLSAGDGVARLVRSHVGWVTGQRRQARFLFEQARAEWLETVRAEQDASNQAFRAAIDRWRAPLVDAGQLPALPGAVFIAQLIGPAQLLCRAWLSGRSAESPSRHVGALVDCARRSLVIDATSSGRTPR